MNTAHSQVLVVDDELSIGGIITRWLEREGHTCLQADSSSAAWRMLQENQIDIVTLDIDMPGEKGIELLPKVKDEFGDTEVIMLTGTGQTRTAIDALTQGAFAYLMKPVERDEVVEQVQKALHHRELVIQNRMYTVRLEERVREQTLDIQHAHGETISRLITASMYRDEETGAHIRRVGLFSEALALAAGWSTTQADQVRLAAPMHDVGKIGIPDQILLKPGRLTFDEFQIMKTHTTVGAEMLSGSNSPMLQLACQIARSHHERWDGSGYPDGLSTANIPEAARIVSIVDVYDALTHNRIYRPAMTEDDAVDILRDSRGEHFDPRLLDLFLDALPTIRQIARQHPDGASNRSFDVTTPSRLPIKLNAVKATCLC